MPFLIRVERSSTEPTELIPTFPALQEALSDDSRRNQFKAFRSKTKHPASKAPEPSKAIRHFLQLSTQLKKPGEMLRIFVRAVGPLIFYYAYKKSPGDKTFRLVSLPTAYLEKEGAEKHWTEPFYYYMAYLTERKDPEGSSTALKDKIRQIRASMWSGTNRRYWELQGDVTLIKTDGETSWDFTCESTLALRSEKSMKAIRIGPEGVDEPNKFTERMQHARLLVSSPLVQSAICRLSEVWHTPSIRNVLLIAPPGSGKEVFVKFLRAGFMEAMQVENEPTAVAEGRGSPQETDNFSLPNASKFEDIADFISRSSVSTESLKPKATPADSSGTSHHAEEDLPKNPVLLFFDEVDKASDAIRSGLLRILEERAIECMRPAPASASGTSKQPERVLVSLKDAIFIFASSTPFESLLSGRAPRDFWTRMQLTVEMGHPFLVGSETDLEQVLEQYVRWFLNDLLLINEEKYQTRRRIRQLYGFDDKSVDQLLASFTDPVMRSDRSIVRPVNSAISMAIAKPLCRMSRVRIPSIRVVRTISERVFWELLAHGILGIEERGVEDINFGKVNEVRREIDKWCQQKVPSLFLEAYS